MADYIPGSDAQFNDWQINFTDYLAANAAVLGVNEEEVKELLVQRADWEDAYRQCLAAQAAATSAREAKDTNRSDWESALRNLAQRLQTSKSTTDAQRAALGITVPDRTSTPVGAPTSRPSARIENRGGLRHTVNFVDENSPTHPHGKTSGGDGGRNLGLPGRCPSCRYRANALFGTGYQHSLRS